MKNSISLIAFLLFSVPAMGANCPDLTGAFPCYQGDILKITQSTDNSGTTHYNLFNPLAADKIVTLTSDGVEHSFYRHGFSASCNNDQLEVNVRKKIDDTTYRVVYKKVQDTLLITVLKAGEPPQEYKCY